jgi:hypothetical protein
MRSRDDQAGTAEIAITFSKNTHLQRLLDGQTQIRTGDTTIFSRTESGPKNCQFAGYLHLPTLGQVPFVSGGLPGVLDHGWASWSKTLAAPVGEQPDQGLWPDSRSYTELYEVYRDLVNL